MGSAGRRATVHTELVLDETVVRGGVDLNGDGDTVDRAVAVADARAVLLSTRVSWTGIKRPRSVTLSGNSASRSSAIHSD